MKKRVTSLLLALLALTSVTLTGFAAVAEEPENAAETVSEQPAIFYLNGEPMESLVYCGSDGVYYVTVESFISAMDAEAMIEEENGVVTATSVTVTGVVDVAEAQEGGTTEADVQEELLSVSAAAGDNYVVANGRCLYVESGNLLVEGKVALPIRVLAKMFNLDVGYNGFVLLTHREGAGAYLEAADTYYDDEALYWLSHIIYAESGNQSLEGRIAVGNVVMNRVKSPLFPNTVYGVVFQKNQFSPASSGSIYRTPNAGSMIAAKLVLEGAVVMENALFFNAASMKNSYAARNRPYIATIGAHAFYA